MSFDISTLQRLNASRWAAAKVTRASEYTLPVQRALAARPRYEAIQASTGVSWVFIACTHYRECGQNFSLSLAQGDPWNQPSRHVPAGRGPFNSFEEAATDALVNCPPHASRNKDWSLPGMLTILEGYNGLGYARMGRPSAYIWSGTDQYISGKYIRDGVFDPNVVDKQLGCAGFILSLAEKDSTILVPRIPATPQKPLQSLPTVTEHVSIPEEVLQWFKEH